MPVGANGARTDGLPWLDMGAAALLALSHLAIALALLALARVRLDFGFPRLPMLFAAFLAACGATHLLDVVHRFEPPGWPTILLNIAAAFLSVLAAVALWIALPRIRARVAAQRADAARPREALSTNEKLQDAPDALGTKLEALVQKRIRALTKANEKLLRSNADLQRFAYVASHDLQSPLRSIHAFMALLQCEHADKLNEEANDWLQRVIRGAERMQGMLDGVLQLSLVDTQTHVPEPVDLRQCAEEALEDLTADLRLHPDASFQIGALPVIMGDSSQWRSVFYNLFSNSLKYRAERLLRVEVRSTKADDGFWIEIRDTGRGIPKQRTEEMFQLFRRNDPDGVHTGHGIGLAMCRRIVERHLGSIHIESDGASGTTVWIQLKR